MRRFLEFAFDILNRDLTGKTWEVRKSHPYFGEMTYFGSKNQKDCYWEAQLEVPGLSTQIGVTMRGTADGPEPSAEIFCKAILADLDALFGLCGSAFEPVFTEWTKQSFPTEWREAFVLDGFGVPPEGNLNSSWEVCYFVEPAGHYFTAQFAEGKVFNVQVDG